MGKNSKLSTKSYKGVRDFYPNEMYIHNYILETMANTAERFGYVEYGASLLEESALYEAKSGEEIVLEQTYTFLDRGERKVTLRPEMTPTIARMIAAHKRDLAFPLRWYSLPNLFRYERPQRGRLREHWQLNVDIFGTKSLEADVEVMSVAYAVMTAFGAKDEMFSIRINSREFMEHVFDFYSLGSDERRDLSKLIDRKNKIDKERFLGDLGEILKKKADLADIFLKFIGENDFTALPKHCLDHDSKRKLDKVIDELSARGIENAYLDVSVIRGFDYYTGIVFEVFDTSPKNNRSLFGGGRYDDLLKIFGTESVPAVGFGMGDVTIEDFLETHKLLPNTQSPTDLYICVLDENAYSWAYTIASRLREKDINVAIDYTNKKVGDQIKTASKLFVPFALCIGPDEVDSNTFILKNLETGDETPCKGVEKLIKELKGQ